MKSGDQKHQDSVEYHEDGTRVEILPRPYGASITTTKPDGSSETIKIGTPAHKQARITGYRPSEPAAGGSPKKESILQYEHVEPSDFASRMEAMYAPIRSTPERHRKLILAALKKLQLESSKWLGNPNLNGQEAKAALQTLDAVLGACPLEVRQQVGDYIQVDALADDEARRVEIRRRVHKIKVGLEHWIGSHADNSPTSAKPSTEGKGNADKPSSKKNTIRQSNQIKPSSTNAQFVTGIGEGINGMSALRKRILGIGLLVICVGSMIEASDRYNGTPSLGWMVAMGATWALVVWLWPERKFQIGRALQLVGKRRQMRIRHKVSNLLKSNFLEEEIFEKMLNDGKQNSLVNLLPGCATNGWRKMSKHELKDAGVVLEYYLEDRLSSIRRLEKMIRKSITSEEVLLELARKRKPVTDWRHMNYAEMKMMIAMASGKKEDFDFLRSR